MNFLKNPNIPSKKVTKLIVDAKLPDRMRETLSQLGIECLQIKNNENLYHAVGSHPDLQIHHAGDKNFVVNPAIEKDFIDRLERLGGIIHFGKTTVSSKYPNSVHYNVARVGKFAFHHTKYTDPILKRILDQQGVEWVSVKQGYSKCSICIVDENSFITEDKSIAKEAEKRGMDVLLIAPQENIRLPGFDNGFLGGATGLIGNRLLALAGNIETLDGCKEILDFLNAKKVKIINLSKEEVLDIGSMLPIMEE